MNTSTATQRRHLVLWPPHISAIYHALRSSKWQLVLPLHRILLVVLLPKRPDCLMIPAPFRSAIVSLRHGRSYRQWARTESMVTNLALQVFSAQADIVERVLLPLPWLDRPEGPLRRPPLRILSCLLRLPEVNSWRRLHPRGEQFLGHLLQATVERRVEHQLLPQAVLFLDLSTSRQ